MPGSPIRKSADQIIFANPRSLSQLITSFFASESQGIPRILFLTFFYATAFCAGRYAFLICPLVYSSWYIVIRPKSNYAVLFTKYQKSVSIVVCSSFLTSSNMSKNFRFSDLRDQMPDLRFSSLTAYLLSPIASMVENIGVEPMTSCVQGRRSSQLS